MFKSYLLAGGSAFGRKVVICGVFVVSVNIVVPHLGLVLQFHYMAIISNNSCYLVYLSKIKYVQQ